MNRPSTFSFNISSYRHHMIIYKKFVIEPSSLHLIILLHILFDYLFIYIRVIYLFHKRHYTNSKNPLANLFIVLLTPCIYLIFSSNLKFRSRTFKSLNSELKTKTKYFLNREFYFIWKAYGMKDCGSIKNLKKSVPLFVRYWMNKKVKSSNTIIGIRRILIIFVLNCILRTFKNGMNVHKRSLIIFTQFFSKFFKISLPIN